MPAHPVVPAAESTAIPHTAEQPERKTEMHADVALLPGILGRRLDTPGLREMNIAQVLACIFIPLAAQLWPFHNEVRGARVQLLD